MIPPLWQKVKRNKKPLDESERGEWKSWLKAQHSENEDLGIWSHQFMGNRCGNSGNSVRFYFGGSKITADGDCSHEIKYPKFICVSISNLLVSLLKRSFFTLEKNLGTLDKNQHHKYECVVLESLLLWSVFMSLCQCYVVLMCTKWGFAGFWNEEFSRLFCSFSRLFWFGYLILL